MAHSNYNGVGRPDTPAEKYATQNLSLTCELSQRLLIPNSGLINYLKYFLQDDHLTKYKEGQFPTICSNKSVVELVLYQEICKLNKLTSQ
jgi:hypothetical protein